MNRLRSFGLAALALASVSSVRAEEPGAAPAKTVWPDLNLRFDGLVHLWAIPWDQNDAELNDPIVAGDPNVNEGFRVRRARFGVHGTLTDSLRFQLQLGYEGKFTGDEEADEFPELEEAFLDFQRGKLPGIRLGVGKVPFGAQSYTSSGTLLLIERAILSEELAFDRDVGVTLYGALGNAEGDGFGLKGFRYWLGLYNGSGSIFRDDNGAGDISYTGEAPSGTLSNPFGLLQTLRLEADFGTAAGPAGETNLGRDWREVTLRVGLNGAVNRELESRTAAFGGDVGLYAGPLSLQFEALWNTTFPQYTGEGTPEIYADTPAFGWYLQGGFVVIPNRLQLAARYDYYDGNQNIEDADDLATFTAGLNFFPRKSDALKFQLNYVRRMERPADLAIYNDSLYLNFGMFF